MLPKEVLFSFFPKSTNKRYAELLNTFSSLEYAWHATKAELKQTKWKQELINEFFFWKKDFNEEKISGYKKLFTKEKRQMLSKNILDG